MENIPMKRWVRKKGWEKNLFWSTSQAQERVKHMHFHFCENRLNEALKNIFPQRQLDSSISNQDTSRLVPDLCIPEHPPARAESHDRESRLIPKTYMLRFIFSQRLQPLWSGRIWHRNWKIYSSQPCQNFQRWPKQHLFHAINNCIIRSKSLYLQWHLTKVKWQKSLFWISELSLWILNV